MIADSVKTESKEEDDFKVDTKVITPKGIIKTRVFIYKFSIKCFFLLTSVNFHSVCCVIRLLFISLHGTVYLTCWSPMVII